MNLVFQERFQEAPLSLTDLIAQSFVVHQLIDSLLDLIKVSKDISAFVLHLSVLLSPDPDILLNRLFEIEQHQVKFL